MNDFIAQPFLLDDEPFDTTTEGTITYHHKLIQGSDEWFQARLGLLTASEMKLALTPTLKVAKNDKVRTHVYELAAQRLTQHVEPGYISDDMLRGQWDEQYARQIYHENEHTVREVGFITNNRWGFTLGYSPDGLVGDDGLIECKSRMAKHQIATVATSQVVENDLQIPVEYVLQCQTGLLISERKWLDFISYSGGLPMIIIRVWPDEVVQDAILQASTEMEMQVQSALDQYQQGLKKIARCYPTERRNYEDFLG